MKPINLSVFITKMSFYCVGDQYALKIRLVDHVYDDQVIDFLTVKIILPEGARSVFALVRVERSHTLDADDVFVLHQKHPHGNTL